MYYDHQNPSSDVVIPQVNASCKPVKGMIFESVDHAYDFYCEYAKKAGFCVRKGDGSNRPYYKRRKRPTIQCGCRAQIFLKSDDGLRFEINDFVEGHNHELVDAKDMHFVRSNRKLTHVQQDIIYELSTLNLRPVKAFNIMRTKYGGFEEVGATKDDYEISKKNYLAFGDIISFDATFKTNKYNMVFVPFTAIDNHYRNVTVGAALLSFESIESYSWLLKVFLDFFGIAPKVVVTDQDPAMKQAISFVLTNSRHRLCMWHIMKKLADKVGATLCNNEDFKCKICDIV
ncbi:protein FAR1-RELATED SEQUENCE 5-like [Bidens hawaiensis]|uniref:protein FAR1-RELATED SEQUENCE 5-like n=1 Tax=Bidens hawaiensis TaxID=980011 RepID=UPI004049D4D3